MDSTRPEAPFTQRIERVFERIQNIMTNNQSQRSDKIRQIVQLIKQHEKITQEKEEERLQLFENIFERISAVEKKSIEESGKREKNLLALQDSLVKAEKKCKNIISTNVKERQQMERKFRDRIDAIFNKEKDLLEDVIGHSNENLSELSNIEGKLPALEEQIRYESQLRSQIQSKIYQQFLEQISELKKLFENQRSQRIRDHEQTLIMLKSMYTKFCDKIKQEEAARERNESLVLRVVEQLVNQISTSYNNV